VAFALVVAGTLPESVRICPRSRLIVEDGNSGSHRWR